MAEPTERLEEADNIRMDTALVTPLLECTICMEPFRDPVVLPCIHSFCSTCIGTRASTTKEADGTFKCPCCHQKYTIPKEGIRGFPKNVVANTLSEIVPSAALRELESISDQIQCEYMYSGCQQAGESLHGEATVFCTQCDAYLCQHCAESHRIFKTLKHHHLLSADAKDRKYTKKVPRCHHHHDQKVTWYCKTCSLPACSDCILENHKPHDTEKLSDVAERFREDLQDVYKLAEKRAATLEKISRKLDQGEVQMKEDLDKVSRDITEISESICTQVKQQAAELQDKVKKARETAEKAFYDAKEGVKIQQENTSKVESCAQTLCSAQAQFTFRTAVQTPSIKQQLMYQQRIAVPSIAWKMNRKSCPLGPLSAATFMGDANIDTTVETNKGVENTCLGSAIQVTKLQYIGTQGISGIAPIYKTMLCVTHYGTEFIWVYTNTGQLKDKIKIPGVDTIYGMVVVDGDQGKLAIVDDKDCKIHIVTLSVDLEVVHSIRKAPFASRRLSKNNNGELVMCQRHGKKCAVVTVDGVVIHDIQLDIPGDRVDIICVAHISTGYMVCDWVSKKVFFTDARGSLLHSSSHCKDPFRGVNTSWGHTLVPDDMDHDIKVFNDSGDFLGSIQDSVSEIKHPHYIHLDEADRLLYVGCGLGDKREVRTYRFIPSELPPLPVTCTVSNLEMSVKLATV